MTTAFEDVLGILFAGLLEDQAAMASGNIKRVFVDSLFALQHIFGVGEGSCCRFLILLGSLG